MNKNALIDNTAFAGLMRCYKPELETHIQFVTDYPVHKKIDYVSTAQILTALICYDHLEIEASSAWHYHSAFDILPQNLKYLPSERASSWANDLKKMLPTEIADLIYTGSISHNSHKDAWKMSEESRKLSLKLFQTTFKNKIDDNIKIPDVYTSPNYIDREEFEKLNSESSVPLTDLELSHAMFLYRGLLLDAFASSNHLTYIPYLYRAEYLQQIPPGKSSEIICRADFELNEMTAPSELKVIEELNKIYYDMLEQLTWSKYERFIPFIGSSILTQTNYDMSAAFDLTLEFREKSNIREFMEDLNYWSDNKVVFESCLKEFKNDLDQSIRHLKLDSSTTRLESWANLSMFWLPNGLKLPITELLKKLPETWKIYFNALFNMPNLNNGHQILLFDHVYALNIIERDKKNRNWL